MWTRLAFRDNTGGTSFYGADINTYGADATISECHFSNSRGGTGDATDSGALNMWPFIQIIGDLLRASVILGGFDAFADAWSTLSGGFDVEEGHGRLKNNLWTEAERPPDMLVNVVVEPPGMPPIVGEVQLHLREILVLKESSLHRMYEVVRASSMDALLAEAARPRRTSLAAIAPAPPRTELAARAAPASEVELV